MKQNSKHGALVLACSVLLAVLIGCGGPKENKLDAAEKQIQALMAKGAPDTLLSAAILYRYQADAAAKISNMNLSRRYTDSMTVALAKAESDFAAIMQTTKPFIDSLMSSFAVRKKELSGIQARIADSLLVIIDSLIAKNWLVAAKDKCLMLDNAFIDLLADENRAKAVRPKLIGTWTSTKKPDSEYPAVQFRKYVIARDGSFTAEESMKGQTEETVKEDWQFYTSGKWDLKGDTVLFMVEKEKCTRQNFWNYKMKDGKPQWVLFAAPAYDTTITDHSKDKYMAFDLMRELFKKK